MSKLQPATEVPRSIDARRSATPALVLMMLSLPTAGCLSPQTGEMMTDVMLGSDTGTAAESTSGASSTRPSIMTTTDDPKTTDEPVPVSTGMTDTTDPDTTTGVPTTCGNGSIEAGEDCDEGLGNDDAGTCTTACKSAACGDGFLQPGVGEVCDDGVNDGSYGGCASDCKSPGPRCGDGLITDMVEDCDGGEPWDVASGCLPNCEYAASCKQIRDSFSENDTLMDGVYMIKPAVFNQMLPVYCDMDADGGGYTFLKVALPDQVKNNASEAEAECDKYGMDLFVPRTQEHAVAASIAAKSAKLEPVGGGTTKGDIRYLSILGIYPVFPGKSCVGQPLNSEKCMAWTAKNGPYWVTAVGLPGQPNTTNCAGCSMYYIWSDGGTVKSYEAIVGDGFGALSQLFMCDTADKLGDF